VRWRRPSARRRLGSNADGTVGSGSPGCEGSNVDPVTIGAVLLAIVGGAGGALFTILKIWFAEPVQVFCSICAPDAVEAPTTSRHPLLMLPERIS